MGHQFKGTLVICHHKMTSFDCYFFFPFHLTNSINRFEKSSLCLKYLIVFPVFLHRMRDYIQHSTSYRPRILFFLFYLFSSRILGLCLSFSLVFVAWAPCGDTGWWVTACVSCPSVSSRLSHPHGLTSELTPSDSS